MHEVTLTWAGLAKRALRVLGENPAPLLGFFGTVVGMVVAFLSI
jgi:biopolymer transport protein ExbB/TolQ